MVDGQSPRVFDLVSDFNHPRDAFSQVVKAGVCWVNAQGVAAQADAGGQVAACVAGGHVIHFVAECLGNQLGGVTRVHVTGALQQIEGVQRRTFQRRRAQGGCNDGGFVDVLDRDRDGFFCCERGIGSHVGGHHGEAVAALVFEVGAVFERDDA